MIRFYNKLTSAALSLGCPPTGAAPGMKKPPCGVAIAGTAGANIGSAGRLGAAPDGLNTST